MRKIGVAVTYSVWVIEIDIEVMAISPSWPICGIAIQSIGPISSWNIFGRLSTRRVGQGEDTGTRVLIIGTNVKPCRAVTPE